MKILTVVGARPQFVKAAAVSRAVRAAGHVMVRHGGRHVDRDGAGRTILRETEAQLLVALSLGFLQCVCDATHTFTRELTLEAVSFVRLQVERHVAA